MRNYQRVAYVASKSATNVENLPMGDSFMGAQYEPADLVVLGD